MLPKISPVEAGCETFGNIRSIAHAGVRSLVRLRKDDIGINDSRVSSLLSASQSMNA